MEWLAALIPLIWQMISGKSGQNAQTATGTTGGTTTTVNETPAKVAFDPLYYALSPTLMKAFGGNYNSLVGAGMPGGARAMGDMGLGNISDIIAMINQSWPDIMKGYTNPATPAPTAPATPAATPKTEGEVCDPLKDTCEEGCKCSALAKGQPGRCRRW
jgi:hypothetical protein